MSKFKFPRQRYTIIDNMFRRHGIFHTADDVLDTIYDRTGEDISVYTFNKDIRAMKDEYGAPIIYNKTKKGYTYSDHSFSIDDIPLSHDDKELLEMAYQAFKTFKGSPLLKKLESTLDKILLSSDFKNVGRKNNQYILQLEEPLSDSGSNWLEILYKSILEKNSLDIVYQKYGSDPVTKIISPYVLKEYRNRWYVIAFDHHNKRAQKTNVLALDRIKSIEYSNQKYIKDPNFIAKDYFKYSFGVYQRHDKQPEKIRIEIYPPLIDYLLSQPLHPTQKSTLGIDGKTLIVEMEVYIGQDLISFIALP